MLKVISFVLRGKWFVLLHHVVIILTKDGDERRRITHHVVILLTKMGTREGPNQIKPAVHASTLPQVARKWVTTFWVWLIWATCISLLKQKLHLLDQHWVTKPINTQEKKMAFAASRQSDSRIMGSSDHCNAWAKPSLISANPDCRASTQKLTNGGRGTRCHLGVLDGPFRYPLSHPTRCRSHFLGGI